MASRQHKSSAPRGEALRQALVEQGRVLIEEQGFTAFNLRELTRRVGVSQPAIYRHFDSKEDLLQAVMVQGFADYDAFAVAAAGGDDEPFGRLHRLGVAYVRFAADNPGWFRVTFGRRGALDALAGATPDLQRSQVLTLQALARIVPPDDPAFGHTWRAWWGLGHGLSFLVIERVFQLVDDDDARVAAASDAIDAWLDALRARWGPVRPPVDMDGPALFAALSRGLPGASRRAT